VPPPLLLADKHTRAGAYLQKAGGLPAGAGGRPPGLVVRYAACGGLFNQHYCHVTAIAMAIALGAEGVVSSSGTLLSCFHSISVARHVARQAASFTC
jgi:hypothetical protein